MSFVLKIREMLEEHKMELDPILYKCFPTGCCGSVSSVLGKLLKENGFGIFEYVSGQSEAFNINSHAWLEKEGIICDITADQFGELKLPKVYVGTYNSFYKSFCVEHRRPYYQCYDVMWDESCYNLLKRYL